MNEDMNKYRHLLDNLPDAYAYHRIVTDSDGNPIDYVFLEVNTAFEKMLGIQRSSLINRRVTEILPGIKEDSFDWIGTYGKVALTGESVQFETYSELLGRWYDVVASSDSKGFFAVTFRDITSRMAERSALERIIRFAQQDHVRSSGDLNFQNLTDELIELSEAKFAAINTYDKETRKTTIRAISGTASAINKACKILGFKLVGKTWDIIPERVNAIREGKLLRFTTLYDAASGTIPKSIASLLQKTFGIGDIYVAEMRFRKQTVGDLIMFMPRKKSLKHPKIIELFAIQVSNIIMRHRSEESLRRNERFLSAVFESIQDGISVLNKDLTVRFTNNVIKFWYKQSLPIEGKKCYECYQNLEKPCSPCPSLRSMKSGKTERDVVRGMPGSPAEWLELFSYPIKSKKTGEVTGVVEFVRDITDLKKTELALHESEKRYRKLFEESPVALFEEDFSQVKIEMDLLRTKGVTELGKYLDENQEVISEWVKKICILEVNQEAKNLFAVNTDEEISTISEHEALGPVSRVFKHEFSELYKGCTKAEFTGQAKDFNGNLMHIDVHLEVVEGHEEKLDRILVSIQDVTEQVKAREEVERSYERVRESFLATVRSLAALVELRDPYTAGHQKRVAQLGAAIAEKLNLEEETIMGIRIAGLLHDIGKLQIPTEILSKPGKLSDLEFDLVKEHPRIVRDVLKHTELPWPVAEIAYQHHEKLDGSGYPRGLKGSEIKIEAKILAVADVVEAMSSHRPYRPAHSLSDALDEIRANRSTKYEQDVVDACVELFEKEGFKFEEDLDNKLGNSN